MQHLLGHRNNKAVRMLISGALADPGLTLNINAPFCISHSLRQKTIDPVSPQRVVLGILQPRRSHVFQPRPKFFVFQNVFSVAQVLD